MYCPSLYEPPLAARGRTTLVIVTETHRPCGARHHSFHTSRSAPITQTGLGNIRGYCRVAGIRYEPAKTLRGFRVAFALKRGKPVSPRPLKRYSLFWSLQALPANRLHAEG